MIRGKIIYRLIFLAITILIIPAIPILIIFTGTSSPEFVIRGTLNLSVSNDFSAWDLYKQAVVNLLSFDLGTSTSSGQPVAREIYLGFVESFKIVLPALFLSYLVGTIIGYINSRKIRRKINNRFDFVFFVPMIVYSYLLLYFAGQIGIDFTSDIRFIFAIIILSIYPTYIVAKSFSSRLKELNSSDFVQFHMAHGFSRKDIFKKFTKRFFILDYLSFLENLVIYMFGFIFFVESPFAINGIGFKFVLGIQRFDYPLIIGFCIIAIVLFSAINILVDYIKLQIDPRHL